MTVVVSKPEVCPRCGHDKCMEYDHYIVKSDQNKLLIIQQCLHCHHTFTEYYTEDKEYIETYFHEED